MQRLLGRLARDLENPEFLTEYLAASAEIERIDAGRRRAHVAISVLDGATVGQDDDSP